MEKIHKIWNKFLPVIARLCLISTFIEDVLRMWSQWNEQGDYLASSWGIDLVLANCFIGLCMVCQCLGSVLVLVNRRVPMACIILCSVILSQSVAYSLLWDAQYLLRIMALIGGIFLLLAASFSEKRKTYAGLPDSSRVETRAVFQLTGRIALLFMFVTLIHFELNLVLMIENVVGIPLIILVLIGYKTTLVSSVLVLWLLVTNFYMNAWWNAPDYQPLVDYLRYDFFQTLAVTGGLLLIISYGPGDLSVDERKKMR